MEEKEKGARITNHHVSMKMAKVHTIENQFRFAEIIQFQGNFSRK